MRRGAPRAAGPRPRGPGYGTPAPAPPPPGGRATAEQLARARQLGLSVGWDAGADHVERRLREFELVSAYAREAWRILAGGGQSPPEVPPPQWNMCIAHLLDDGHLASRIAAVQRQRDEEGITVLRRNADYRRVARHLRARLEALLPRRGLLARLFGRRRAP